MRRPLVALSLLGASTPALAWHGFSADGSYAIGHSSQLGLDPDAPTYGFRTLADLQTDLALEEGVVDFGGDLDEGSSAYTIQRNPFRVAGVDRTSFTICANGYVNFTGSECTFIVQSGTGGGELVYGTWVDLDVGGGGSVHVFESTSNTGDIVVHFEDVAHYGTFGTPARATFQMVFERATQRILVHHGTMGSDTSTAAVGIRIGGVDTPIWRNSLASMDLAVLSGGTFLFEPDLSTADADNDGLTAQDDCDDGTFGIQGPTVDVGRDSDGDGYYAVSDGVPVCFGPLPGYGELAGDCVDSDPGANPGMAEVTCNGVDDDCDAGTTDDADADSDGFTCIADGDCDDDNGDVFPGNPEVCDGLDNDCVNGVDDTLAFMAWYPDGDGDGNGAFAASDPISQTCSLVDLDVGTALGQVVTGVDVCSGTDDVDLSCQAGTGRPDVVVAWTAPHDGTFRVHTEGSALNDTVLGLLEGCPSGLEIECDDDDGVGLKSSIEVTTTAGTTFLFAVQPYGAATCGTGQLFDLHVDVLSAPVELMHTCDTVAPTGFSATFDDCDDLDSANFQGNFEVCDFADNDCDGNADQGLPTNTVYDDTDGDGYGDPGVTADSCGVPAGYSANDQDCDPGDFDVNPGVPEIDGNAVDENCDTFLASLSAADLSPGDLVITGDHVQPGRGGRLVGRVLRGARQQLALRRRRPRRPRDLGCCGLGHRHRSRHGRGVPGRPHRLRPQHGLRRQRRHLRGRVLRSQPEPGWRQHHARHRWHHDRHGDLRRHLPDLGARSGPRPQPRRHRRHRERRRGELVRGVREPLRSRRLRDPG
ncbi:MAG: putative metal-binding motif-containing protein [Alphaproteobacteria bacterium]|nr:putative metal-binding motif-containing protein [Alphaproteobacteria bacterium]